MNNLINWSMKNLRKTNSYTIRKVKRNFEGSYDIFKDERKSEIQYNMGTVRYLLKMSDAEFLKYAETLKYE